MARLTTAAANMDEQAVIPRAPGLPLIGQTYDFLTRPVENGLNIYRKYGPVVRGNTLGVEAVALAGPDALQQVLRNADDTFSSNGGWQLFIGRFFRRGVMLLDFDEHRFHRGILQAAFKKPAMLQYLERMNPAITRGIAGWRTGRTFSVYPALKSLTLDIATEVFMGEALGAEADRINTAFVDCVRAGTALVRYPVPGGRWWRGVRGRAVLEDFFRSRIAAKRANPGTDLFSRLCVAEDDQGNRFSDEDVVNHMIFVMMAAHDTSTITLSTMFYYLGRHPEWQDKVRAEALALDSETLTHDDLATRELMDRVMKESLRLLSPVHVIPRRTVKPVTIAGYRLPADTFVVISPIVNHHLPDWWTDPERFDPDRFSPERAEHKRHPYLFVPFGGGAHMCIGLHFAEMEVKAILHQIVRRYRWTLPHGYRMPVNFTSLPTPADGLPVHLQHL